MESLLIGIGLGIGIYIMVRGIRRYFCSKCGHYFIVKFCLGGKIWQLPKPCPECGNKLAIPYDIKKHLIKGGN